MRRQLLAALCVVCLLSACGGSDDTSQNAPPGGVANPLPTQPETGGGSQPPPQPEPPDTGDERNPEPTPVGTALGTAVSKVIGAAGGQLVSADSTVTIDIPAGAFNSEQTVSIQAITNQAHGGRGTAYRIRPEGLNTTVPMTVRFQYVDADLRGTVLEAMTIAYQDATGVWFAYPQPVVDATQRTLSVQTNHFSDWALILGTQIVPHTATVSVGQSLALQVIHCEREVQLDESEDLTIPVPILDCQARPATSFLTSGWSVNAVEGGGGLFGTIVGDTDRWTGRATYTAPATKPERNTVSVSAQHRSLVDDTTQTLLVANITIVDGTPDCRQLRSMQTFDAELSFDEFSFTATWPHSVHTGYHAGRIMGTLRKSVSSDLAPFDIWTTNLDPLKGLRVVVEDTHVHSPPDDEGYTETFIGSGRPHEGQDAPSFIGLKVNYDTCTFDVFGSFTVMGTYTYNGESREGPIGVGGLYLRNQTIPTEQVGSGFLEGSLPIGLINDIDGTGYVPHEPIGASGRTLNGNTTARWRITATRP